ncbi:hypothetical protein ABMA27_009175 [Loxostege sticticalis]|uniref:Uncharacterized protein n=1 Tax=Loxostege sticticalis TaxID=481309 RepID=A0ABR3HA69_LOXSC
MSDCKSVLFCEESEDLSTLMDTSDDTELVELCEIAVCRMRLSEPFTSRAQTPPSPDQNVMIGCEVCKRPVKKRYLASHYRSNTHKNNAFRIHQSFPNVTLLETAFGKRIHTFRITPISDNVDLLVFDLYFETIRDTLITLLNESIAELKTYKVNFILHANLKHQSKELTNTFDFQTSNFIINECEDLTSFLITLHETISSKISEIEKKDSGWSLKNIISLDINVNKFNPLRGSSYTGVTNYSTVINVKNADVQCFKWALLSALYPAEKSSDRVTSYSKYEHKLNFTDISFPVKLSEIPNIEKMTNIKFHRNIFIPMILHNLSNYDAHFMVHALNFTNGEVQIIPQNKEKYITFTKVIKVNGKGISLRFIDS